MFGKTPMKIVAAALIALAACGSSSVPSDASTARQSGAGFIDQSGFLPSSGGGGSVHTDGTYTSGSGTVVSPINIGTGTQKALTSHCGGGTPVMLDLAQNGTPSCGAAGAGTMTSLSDSGAGDFTIGSPTTAATIAAVYGSSHLQHGFSGGNVAHKFVQDINPTTGVATVGFAVDTAANGTSITCSISGGNSLSCSLNHPTIDGTAAAGSGTAKFVQKTTADGTETANEIQESPDTQERVYEPFLGGCGVNSNILNWGNANSGAATAPTAVAGSPGLCGISTGTAATNGRESFTGTVNGLQLGTGAGKIILKARVTVEALSIAAQEYSLRIGLANSASGEPTAGIFFMYDRGNTATSPTTGAGNSSNKDKWICNSSDNSVRTEFVMDGTVVSDGSFTTVNAPVVATTFDDLEIDYDPAGPEADFYVNGTKRCVITSHLPSGSGGTHTVSDIDAVILKSAGTGTAGIADFDYITFRNYNLAR